MPTPIHLPSGCVFHGRLIHADERCRKDAPVLDMLDNGTFSACHTVKEGRL